MKIHIVTSVFAWTLVALGCLFPATVLAQEPQSPDPPSGPAPGDDHWLLPLPEVEADPAIPGSREVLRYDWGDDISSHYQVETLLHALARSAPDRTRLVQYGNSVEGRSLNYLVISSPENIARLEEIRSNNLRLANPHRESESAPPDWVENQPAIVWLAYAVHGNEISPSDAALVTAWHLLADRRETTRQMLQQLVVIIDPLQNPDGRDRFVNVYRETRGNFTQPFPLANEHTERWPSGRSNHYWFDMNRDWFRHSQPEVRAKVAAYLHWDPQIYVDAHEMGANSTYFFPPPTDPKNPFLLPAQHQWFSRLGRHQAGWFDRFGFGYMTREVFDAFYPGYGSEWPTLQGGLGVLWEQASPRGQEVLRDDQTRLTYHDAVRNHYISGIATVEFAAANRQALLGSFQRAKRQAVELGREGPVRHYFVPPGRPGRARNLMAMLERNGIEVFALSEPLTVECTDLDGHEAVRTVPAGSFHIPVAQPGGRLLRTLFDRRVEMDEKFLRRQLERNELRLPDEIYDVTAWSMPLAFGIECWSAADVDGIPGIAWDEKDNDPAPTVPAARIAWLMPPDDSAMIVLSRLLQNEVRVHVADEPFTMQGREYPRGTLIVKRTGNPDDLVRRLEQAVAGLPVELLATDTAWVDKGAHMGGPDVIWVRPPEILLLVNRPTNYSSGHTWYLFDQVLGYPTTRVNGRDFDRVDLSKFNTVVLPDGSWSEMFDEEDGKRLADWVALGGTLITMRGATAWAAKPEINLIRNRVLQRKITPARKSTAEEDDTEPLMVTPDNVPGAFFHSDVFPRHWVTFGSQPDLSVFYSGNVVLAPVTETDGRALVSFAGRDQLLSSGFCWPASLELLAETPYVVYRPQGEGHVVAFADDPNFRAMYPALQRLFVNAAMFGAGH